MRVKPEEEMTFELELRCLAYRHATTQATRDAIDLADGISGLASVIGDALALELSAQSYEVSVQPCRTTPASLQASRSPQDPQQPTLE